MSNTYIDLAQSLNKKQRQALRRISRGQTINWSAFSDPLVSRFYTMNVPRPDPNMNVVEWCDWEAEARSARPQLTEFGAEVLEALERITIEHG